MSTSIDTVASLGEYPSMHIPAGEYKIPYEDNDSSDVHYHYITLHTPMDNFQQFLEDCIITLEVTVDDFDFIWKDTLYQSLKQNLQVTTDIDILENPIKVIRSDKNTFEEQLNALYKLGYEILKMHNDLCILKIPDTVLPSQKEKVKL